MLFAAHDPLRPQMDVVLALADSAGEPGRMGLLTVYAERRAGCAGAPAARAGGAAALCAALPAGPGLVLDEGVPVPDEAELDVFDRWRAWSWGAGARRLPALYSAAAAYPRLLCVRRRSDLAALRAKVKAALQDWEREQAIYAEVCQYSGAGARPAQLHTQPCGPVGMALHRVSLSRPAPCTLHPACRW